MDDKKPYLLVIAAILVIAYMLHLRNEKNHRLAELRALEIQSSQLRGNMSKVVAEREKVTVQAQQKYQTALEKNAKLVAAAQEKLRQQQNEDEAKKVRELNAQLYPDQAAADAQVEAEAKAKTDGETSEKTPSTPGTSNATPAWEPTPVGASASPAPSAQPVR